MTKSLNLKIIKVLKKTRKILIENEWIQGYYAKNQNDKVVHILNPDACKFCLSGALTRASYTVLPDSPDTYTHKTTKEIQHQMYLNHHILSPLSKFNDDIALNKQDIINLLNDTINRMEQKQ